MIIRRHLNSCFTVLPNGVAQDVRLSIEARGGIAYLLSLPGDWEVDLDHLGRAFRTGRDKTRGIVNELISNGYVVRQRKHAAGGTFDGFEYVIFDDPAAARAAFPEAFDNVESPETENTSVVAPATPLPAPDFQALAYKKKTKNLQRQNLREARSSAVDGSGDPAEVDQANDDFFVSFMDRWPSGKTDNRQKAFASWSKLSDADRRRALDGVDPYRIASKAAGRKYLCSAATYLADAPWRQLGLEGAATPTGPLSMVAAFSRTWWFVFHARRRRGQPVRLMIAQAAEGRGWSMPQVALPTIDDEQRLWQVATASAEWQAYRDDLAQAGAHLPDLSAPFAWVPSAEPASGEPGNAAAAEQGRMAPATTIAAEQPGAEPAGEARNAIEFVSKDRDPFLFATLAGRFKRERGRALMALQSRGTDQGWYFASDWVAEAKRGALSADGRVQLPDPDKLTDGQRRALHSIRSEMRGWRSATLPRFPMSGAIISPRRQEAGERMRLAS